MFRNKVEITLPFRASNKLLTILHYGAPLVRALLAAIVARSPSPGRLKCLIYTFLHGEFEGFLFFFSAAAAAAAKREVPLKALLSYGLENRRSSLFSWRPKGIGTRRVRSHRPETDRVTRRRRPLLYQNVLMLLSPKKNFSTLFLL